MPNAVYPTGTSTMNIFTRHLIITAILAMTATVSAADKKNKDKGPDQSAKTTAWKITGDLEEACSCAAACPCWFDSKPTKKTCDGFQALFIKKGNYGKTKLDGLAIANMVQSPEGQSMMESFGNWNFSYLYIDEKATPEQRKALDDIGRQVLPFMSSKKIEVRYVPITRKIEGKDHEISLGKEMMVRGHLMEGGQGGAPHIVNPPGADPIHKEYDQGVNTKYTFNDAAASWTYEGTNYMHGNFSVDNVLYAKFAAGLAQKMEAMKKGDDKK